MKGKNQRTSIVLWSENQWFPVDFPLRPLLILLEPPKSARDVRRPPRHPFVTFFFWQLEPHQHPFEATFLAPAALTAQGGSHGELSTGWMGSPNRRNLSLSILTTVVTSRILFLSSWLLNLDDRVFILAKNKMHDIGDVSILCHSFFTHDETTVFDQLWP